MKFFNPRVVFLSNSTRDLQHKKMSTQTFRSNYDPQIMTEDNISDDVFEVDDDRSSVTNVHTGGLTSGERPPDKTPSPTGYRDYKPPAEVLSNNYSTTFRTTRDFDSVRSTLKRDHEKEDNFTHKVSRVFSSSRRKHVT